MVARKRRSKQKAAVNARQQGERAQVLTDQVITRLREATLLLAVALSIFLLVALFSYHYSDPAWSHTAGQMAVKNVTGPVGAWLADFSLYMCGYLAFLLPILLSYLAWIFYRGRKEEKEQVPHYPLLLMRGIGLVLVVISGCALSDLYFIPSLRYLPFDSGGIVGQLVSSGALLAFSAVGSVLLLLAIFLVGITLLTGFSWLNLAEKVGWYTLVAMANMRDWLVMRWGLWREQKEGHASLVRETASASMSVGQRVKAALPKKNTPVITAGDSLAATSGLQPSAMADESPVAASSDVKAKPKKTPRISRKGKSGLPQLHLLDEEKTTGTTKYTQQQLELRSQDVEARLADFGVAAQVVAVHPGPVVTRFELALAAGTKVSKITALAKDLARSLSVVSVRVVEVIPGKSVIGLELPNEQREVVQLQAVLASKQYKQVDSSLALALGKDIAGVPVVVDLAKMPHLLVAGTTGSGKSVGLNAMLLSLLYKATPEEVRLIMIDPKMLELSIYDGIPHLLVPVVTDMKDAASALRWCVAEMERRYRLMAALGVRNIAGFNQKVSAAKKAGQPLLDPLLNTAEGEAPPELQTLPKIVVLADEFADMMVVVGKKVETLIARLAQKARAAGIHLILATQRPSVDVITGLIKANIPTRIAFQVSSKVDSRTILDQQGAEQLLGHGDMLYLPPGSGVPIRVHGAFVDDNEVHRVVSFLKKQAAPEYLDDILDGSQAMPSGDPVVDAVMSDDSGGAEQDAFYDEAVHMVTKSRRVSVSSVQRRFKIGYNRAARIVEAMEEAGVVSQMEQNGQREVLAPPPPEN